MIVGIGLDVVDIQRIEKAYKKSNRFANKILTEKEFAIFEILSNHRKLEFLAGRFAAKEAFSKAFGTGIGVLRFHDMEILPDNNNKPMITCKQFTGQAFVSITHTKTIAVAQVVLEV